MIIVLAANKKYRELAIKACQCVEKLGYNYVIYDLGDLGFGEKFEVNNDHFQKHGYYKKVKHWKSKALHKPGVIQKTIQTYPDEFITYLDIDAFLINRIDEVQNDNYDIGVTLRSTEEMQTIKPENKAYMGCINAGVLFCNSSQSTKDFILEWSLLTQEVENDQYALNLLVGQGLKNDHTKFYKGAVIKGFPCNVYNFYYFSEDPSMAKIVHFKSNCRVNLEQFNQKFT